MNSLFLALDRFGLAQDFLALAAGLAQHCRRVSQFTQIYPGPGPALTDGRETRREIRRLRSATWTPTDDNVIRNVIMIREEAWRSLIAL